MMRLLAGVAAGSDEVFSYVGEGFCSTATCSPGRYGETTDILGLGLDPKEICLNQCIEKLGKVNGIYLANGKCGCCKDWDQTSITAYDNYHLYRVSQDVVKEMVPIPYSTEKP